MTVTVLIIAVGLLYFILHGLVATIITLIKVGVLSVSLALVYLVVFYDASVIELLELLEPLGIVGPVLLLWELVYPHGLP